MFVVDSLPVAIVFCIVTMLGWGSWANTQKLAGKEKWPFELFYWDYAVGVFLFSVIFAFTLGSSGSQGMATLENLRASDTRFIWPALLSGALFNLASVSVPVVPIGTLNALQSVAARRERSVVGGGAARECGAVRVGEEPVAPPRSLLSADAGLSGQS